MQQRNFDKKPLQVSEQIVHLQNSCLSIPDKNYAIHCLNTVSYYRLSAYFKPFETTNFSLTKFKDGAVFDDIWQLYVFDKELRLLVMDALVRRQMMG